MEQRENCGGGRVEVRTVRYPVSEGYKRLCFDRLLRDSSKVKKCVNQDGADFKQV